MYPLIHPLIPLVLLIFAQTAPAAAVESWRAEWPRTDFARHAVPLGEIRSGGVPKDGIPAIDAPRFRPLSAVGDIPGHEPVIGLVLGGEARAYPIRILHWHEIVNDTVAGLPVAVTYCPLCNAAIVFDRRVAGRVLDFGTTGKLRHSDLVMYDRQTESWWQQFTGEAIVGAMTGKRLEYLPSRLESLDSFRARAPNGVVLVPNDPSLRPYGRNPYVGYDRSERPFLYDGSMPGDVPPMMRVVAVGDQAWTLELLRSEKQILAGDLELSWQAGQASALEARTVAGGRDVGNVVVRQRGGGDVPYDVTFAFAFFAFRPDGVLHTPDGPVHKGG